MKPYRMNRIPGTPWSLMWTYLVASSLWILATDLLYDFWARHLDVSYILFSSLRIACLFIFSLWVLRKLVMRASRAERYLESFVEHHPEAILILNNQGHIIELNTKFEELFVVSRASYVGQHWSQSPFIPTDKVSESREIVQTVLQGQVISGLRTSRRTYQGSSFDASVSAFKLDDIGMAITIRDIRRELQTEERLLQSEKLAAVGQLAAGVAHEIRNPLTSINGFLQILAIAPDDKKVEYIEIMSQELQQILRIVTDMLALARPQSHEFSPVQVTEFVTGVYQLVRPEVLLRDTELSMEISSAVRDVVISGDEQQLRQVLINLVQNALDALAHAPTKRIVLRADCDEDNVLIGVEDTGSGISDEQLQKILEPFYTTKDQGTGLGLYLCSQIIEYHHGRMWFESPAGRGTTAHISLPYTRG